MEIPQMIPCVHMPLEPEIFGELVEKAKDWALMHGISMRSKSNFKNDSVTFTPFTLIPSSFPKTEFEKALNIQTILNELFHKVAHDHEFLSESLRSVIEVDDFTKKLFELYETITAEGSTQDISLGIFRSDYLLEFLEQLRIKQVEFNTISVSYAGACTELTHLHRFILRDLGKRFLLSHIPENNAVTGVCEGMIEAWKMYNKPTAAILFVVEDITFNICDQRFHEFEIHRLGPDIKVIRRTFTDVFKRGRLTPQKELVIDNLEIALVYFRSGYEPAQYKGENEWNARLLMERSKAIKCPSIQYQLAGTKKVQQALTKPNALERYFSDPEKTSMIRDVFTGIYSLDFDKFGDEAIELALQCPEKFILKPQREGGGHNIFGMEVKKKIEEMRESEERKAWILMARIVPPTQESYIIRPGDDFTLNEVQQVISELGIFGVVIGDPKRIFVNRQAGHMLRTKTSSDNEGGITVGYGCLDSPFLID